MAAAVSLPDLSARLQAAARLVRPSWVPHKPTPKQAEFLALPGLEALYGGAAGGGKSDALLMGAAAYVHEPRYSALLLRRKYTDLALPGAIMDRAKSWWQGRGDVHWSEKDKRFTFPSGATISFGYLDTDADKYRYQSAEFQFIGFDELTQFPERSYRYLLSRLRRPEGSRIPLRARAASNPGGIGHDWVFRRFVHAKSAEHAFVPARLADNPHLDALAYERSLAQLDPITRKQLLEGLWIRDTGGLVYGAFSESVNELQALPKAESWTWLLGIDFGVVDACAFTVLGWRPHDPCVYVAESYRIVGMIPSEAAAEYRRLAETYPFVRVVGDTSGLGKAFAEEMRRRHAIPVEAAEKQNKIGYIGLLNGALAEGLIKVISPRCGDLLNEWATLSWAESVLRKEDPGSPNDVADSALYAWRAAYAFLEEPEPETPTEAELAQQEVERMRRDAEKQFARRKGLWR